MMIILTILAALDNSAQGTKSTYNHSSYSVVYNTISICTYVLGDRISESCTAAVMDIHQLLTHIEIHWKPDDS